MHDDAAQTKIVDDICSYAKNDDKLDYLDSGE